MMRSETIDIMKKLLFPQGYLRIAYIVFTLGMLGLGTFIVQVTGGTQLAYLHIMYFPIVFAGLIFSIPGGIITGVLAGLLIGPGMDVNTVSLTQQPLVSWLSRLVIFSLVGGFSGVGSSIFRSYLKELEIKYTTDPNTGLPNLAGLKKHFKTMSEQGEQHIAIVVIDLFQMRRIDQALGTEGIVEVIRQIATNLINEVGDLCVVGHLHAKRFALVIPDNKNLITILEKCNKIADSNYQLKKIPMFIEMRMGIANFPDDGHDLASLTRKARLAVDSAERKGQMFACYGEDIETNAERNLLMLNRLKKAIDEDMLDLHFQPKVQISEGKPVGLEALVRWTDPILGQVQPMDFIPLTEETTLINPFTKWLIEKAVLKIKEVHQAGFEIQVSINVSMKNFLDPTVLEHLHAVLDKHNVPPRFIELEVTETAVAMNINNVAQILEELRRKDIRIAVDDFGTGQASQHYLLQLPMDVIKIDKMFVGDIENNAAAAAIVRSGIMLGHELGLEVVAEGVETQKQADLLKEWNCDLGQGYLFARPMPNEELMKWLKVYKPLQKSI